MYFYFSIYRSNKEYQHAKITAAITAVGGYVPKYRLTNKELETMVDTNDEWIRTRTGVEEKGYWKEKD